MTAASDYFTRAGFSVRNVARERGHGGFDLLVTKGDDVKKIEVKGCSEEWGIPDFYVTEFDDERRLVADVLCVVYFLSDRPIPKICLIPREAIPPELVTPQSRYRISSKFKKRSVLEKYCV